MNDCQLSIEYQKIVQALVDDPVRKRMLADMTDLLMIHGSVAYKVDQLGNIEPVEHWSSDSAKDTYYEMKDRLEAYSNLLINQLKGGTKVGLENEGLKNCKLLKLKEKMKTNGELLTPPDSRQFYTS